MRSIWLVIIALAVGVCGWLAYIQSTKKDSDEQVVEDSHNHMLAKHLAAFKLEQQYASQLPAQDQINTLDTNKLTPLMEAARYDNLQKATQLIQMGADVNAKTNLVAPPSTGATAKPIAGLTALHIAAGIGDLKMVSLLLDHGANSSAALTLNDPTAPGITPTMVAIWYRHASTLDALLAHDPKPANLSDLFDLSVRMFSMPDEPSLFPPPASLTSPEPPPPKPFVVSQEQKQSTERIFNTLLALNPDLKAHHSRFLEFALYADRLDLVKLLLDRGADPNGHLIQVVSRICEADVPSPQPIPGNPVPERTVSLREWLDLAEDFIAHGASINEADQYGTTPLMAANSQYLEHPSPAAIHFVLSHNPNLEAKDKTGHTTLAFAAMANNLTMARELVARHADVNTLDKDGYSPLMQAIGSKEIAETNLDGHPDMVKLLLQAGAKKDIKSQDGMTALKLAYKGHFSQVIHLLSPSGS